MNSDVVVVGGGCAGCATAYFLSRAGVSTTLLERDALASAASGVATGISRLNLRDTDMSAHADLIRRALPAFQRTIPVVADESGIDVHYETAPGLTIPLTVAAWEELKTKALQEGHRVLSAKSARELEPGLGPEIIGATWDVDRRRVDSSALTRAYARAAEQRGAKIVMRAATGLEIHDDKVTGVKTADGTVSCSSVVLAMGISAVEASDWLHIKIPIKPVKGERLRLRFGGPRSRHFLSSQGIRPGFAEHGHVIFEEAGLVSVGSTFEDRGRDLHPTEAARDRLMRMALHIWPALIDAEIQEHLVGLRPIPEDGLPILGPVPGVDGVYAIAGHSAINCSAIFAAITRDYILHGSTDQIDSVEPFFLDRFQGERKRIPLNSVLHVKRVKQQSSSRTTRSIYQLDVRMLVGDVDG